MKRTFDGTFKDFKNKLKQIEIFGNWEKRPFGVWQMTTRCGCILSWSETRKTYWSQGKEDKNDRLDKLLAAHFEVVPRDYSFVAVGNHDEVPYEQIAAYLVKKGLKVFPAKGA